MDNNRMILGKNQVYSLDSNKTRLNNNVLVVGASGAGKTRGVVTPNLLEATGSYIVTDPKGNLYEKYKDYLENKGYVVKKLDFTDPLNSIHYNFFRYIRNTQDIVKIAHMLVYQHGSAKHMDPFWDESSQLLVQSIIAYLMEQWEEEDQNLRRLTQLIGLAQMSGNMETQTNPLDILFEDLKLDYPESYAVQSYERFRVASAKTLRSILVCANSRFASLTTPEINELTRCDDVDIDSIGERKTALFVVVSDTDRTLDSFVNIFFTQAINELCRYADRECEGNCLPIPVRFIMDDFATNCKINEFPRMISSIRSRGISTMLLIQTESQLEYGYGDNWKTIIGNCDSYVYMGGNDVATAKAVAERCDVPFRKIMNMPIGANWVFRRGHEPISGNIIDLDEYLYELEKLEERDKEKCV